MTAKPPGDEAKARCLAAITGAVERGERCPMNDSLPGKSLVLSALARAGVLRVEVFMHNWRVVTLLTGDMAGRSTKAAPEDRKGVTPRPYLTITTAGSRRNGEYVDRSRAPRPTLAFDKDGRRVR